MKNVNRFLQSSLQRAEELHYTVIVLVFQFFDDVQVGALRGAHIGMSKTSRHRRNGNSRIKQQRGMRMP